jgi:RNA polymerase sigma factor (sigma-70 family)
VRDFERLYAEHAESLMRFVIYRVGDRDLAEDLVADTFERVYRTRVRFDTRRASEKTWIYGIALNLIRDHARHHAVVHKPHPGVEWIRSEGGASDDAAVIEDRDLIGRALEQLSTEEHEVVALRFGADLTNPEIARITHESLSTTEGRLYRALRKLREIIGDEVLRQ